MATCHGTTDCGSRDMLCSYLGSQHDDGDIWWCCGRDRPDHSGWVDPSYTHSSSRHSRYSI